MQNEIIFFGMKVTTTVIRVSPKKAEIFRSWAKQTSVTDLKSSQGLLQFFRSFIGDFLMIAAPLANLTKKNLVVGNLEDTCYNAF